MEKQVLITALLCLCYWWTVSVEGVIFSPMVQNGQFISNNSMSRISVRDVNSALRCQSELTIDSNVTIFTHGCLVGDGDNPVPCAYGDGISIDPFGTITRGWSGRRADETNHRVYYLTRSQLSPEEGYYNCHIADDINPQRGLYILYPITSVTAAIEVERGTSTFRVRCTSTGGRALDMAASGPNGYYSDLSSGIQPVGTPRFIGSDSYTAITEVILDGMAGYVYQCSATSVTSNTASTTIEIAAAPTIHSLEQIAVSKVRVVWTASLTPSVVGYIIHYSLSGGSESVTGILSSTSTSTEITGLINGGTYNFSVAVIISNVLPGISEERTIILAPDTPEGVEVIAGSASVRVFWHAVVDADTYFIIFTQVEGDDQQIPCPTDSHIASLTVATPSTTISIAVGEDVESTVTDMLRAYTTYEVTIKAVSDVRGISQPSEPRRVLTPQTSAGEAPGNVRAETISSTEISVQWSGLSDCRLVNGRITSYRVQFTATDRPTQTRDQELRDGEDWRSGGEMLLTQLTSITTYSIAVAAVNENGDVGLFSDSVTVQVKQDESSQRCTTGSLRDMVIAVVIGVVGIVLVGVCGLIGGAVIAKRRVHRPQSESRGGTLTGENPAYGMGGLDSEKKGDHEICHNTHPSSKAPEEEGIYEKL